MLKFLKRMKAKIQDISHLLFDWYWERLKNDLSISKRNIKNKIELKLYKIKKVFSIFKIKINNIIIQEFCFYTNKWYNVLLKIFLIKESEKSIKYICFL